MCYIISQASSYYSFIKSGIFFRKFSDAGIQDVSTSISIRVKFEEMTHDDDEDESDKHLEARDRRYSCLKINVY